MPIAGLYGQNKAKTAVSVAVAAKPEVEIWRRPPKSTFCPWFPICSRQFLAKTYRFATMQNVTDRRLIVRSAKNQIKLYLLKSQNSFLASGENCISVELPFSFQSHIQSRWHANAEW